jgi:hypothetical protein
MWPQSKHVYTGTMLPVNGSRSVSVDWHLGHGGMVSADSGNLGNPDMAVDRRSVTRRILSAYRELPLPL